MSLHIPKVRRAAIAFILVTAVLDIVAMGIVIPVLPHLIEEFVGIVRGRTANSSRTAAARAGVPKPATPGTRPPSPRPARRTGGRRTGGGRRRR